MQRTPHNQHSGTTASGSANPILTAQRHQVHSSHPSAHDTAAAAAEAASDDDAGDNAGDDDGIYSSRTGDVTAPSHTLPLPPSSASRSPLSLLLHRLPRWDSIVMALFVVVCVYYLRTAESPMKKKQANRHAMGAAAMSNRGQAAAGAAAAAATATVGTPSSINNHAAAAVTDADAASLFNSDAPSLMLRAELHHLLVSLNTSFAPPLPSYPSGGESSDSVSVSWQALSFLGASASFHSVIARRTADGSLAEGIQVRVERGGNVLKAALERLSRAIPSRPLNFDLSSLHRAALYARHLRSGDPVADDPRSPYHPDYKHCKKLRKLQKKQSAKTAKTTKAASPTNEESDDAEYGGRRCRKPEHSNLAELFEARPAIVWQLVRESIIDMIDARIRDTNGTYSSGRCIDAHTSQQERHTAWQGAINTAVQAIKSGEKSSEVQDTLFEFAATHHPPDLHMLRQQKLVNNGLVQFVFVERDVHAYASASAPTQDVNSKT